MATARPQGVLAGARVAGVQLAVAALYLALAWLATRFGVFETLSVWYAPAGLAIGLGAVGGWRMLPGLALGEVLVGVLLFDVLGDFGWLVVPNGVAYTAVYVAAGRVVARAGATEQDARWRRHLVLVVFGGLVAPLAGAVVGMTFQLLGGLATTEEFLPDVLVWWLGDAVGVASIAVTVLSIAVRARRGAPWWALPETSTALSLVYVLSPSVLVLALAGLGDDVVPFTAAVFVPVLALAVTKGVAAVALSAPFTSLTLTMVADSRFATDVLALTDLQLLLLIVLLTGLGAALVTEERDELLVRLRDSEKHLAQAQRQARAGSFVWNVIDDQATWSEGLYALYGIEEGPVTAADYLAHIHPDDREDVGDALGAALVDGTEHEHTYRVVRADGELLHVRSRIEVREFDGRVIELIGTCTDVTAEEQANAQLAAVIVREQDAHLAHREATVAVERAERIKDALLVAVSHEVRTPLTIVRGLAETLCRPELADQPLRDHRHLLDRLDANTARLRDVLRDLLDVDRIGRGVVAPVRRPVNLRALATEVVSELALPTPVSVASPDEPVSVDARLTARILEHLLSNAARHSPDGEAVTLTISVHDGVVELVVEDRGAGVPETERTRVFEAFEQHDIVRHSPRTGVGLFLVARFAELHGGRAWVTGTSAGHGAAFHVLLGLAPVAVGTAAQTDAEHV